MSVTPDSYGLAQALPNVAYMSISTVQLKKIKFISWAEGITIQFLSLNL